jgi:hypothetical protein
MRGLLALATTMAVAALSVGCGGSATLKKVGEACVSSTECDVGLLCDLAGTPPRCANMGSVDGAIPVDAARVDAGPRDGAAVDAPIAIDAPVAIDAPDDAAVAIDAPDDAAIPLD